MDDMRKNILVDGTILTMRAENKTLDEVLETYRNLTEEEKKEIKEEVLKKN